MQSPTNANSDSPSKPKRNRRWLQFSLRTLMLAMLVIGCGLGWMVNDRLKNEEILSIVKTLEAYGWFFDCDPR